MTSFRFTTFYSLRLAVSSRYLVIKCGYLAGLHIVTSIPNREVSNSSAFAGSSFNALSAVWLSSGWLTLSAGTHRTVTVRRAWVCLKSLVPDHQAQLAPCNYFQCVRPFLSEKTIRLPADSPLILLSLTEWLLWPHDELLKPLWGIRTAGRDCGTVCLSHTRTLSWVLRGS